jgi:hypothetical protein
MPLSQAQIQNRAVWVEYLANTPAEFSASSRAFEQRLRQEISSQGLEVLIGHLAFCGVIPEGYTHDSSQEKLYSKYTDILLGLAFEQLGLTSLVLSERGDAADVECVAPTWSFVADAKAFRLSRTAKNQKDFKIAALHTWKRGKPFAMVVCPLFQLPSSKSQIYQQASSLSVCIFSYSHLIVLLRMVQNSSAESAQNLLYQIFQMVQTINPSKDAFLYWQGINTLMYTITPELWQLEKENSAQALEVLKAEAQTFLAAERERILRLTRTEAVSELLKAGNIESRAKVIAGVLENRLFEVAT